MSVEEILSLLVSIYPKAMQKPDAVTEAAMLKKVMDSLPEEERTLKRLAEVTGVSCPTISMRFGTVARLTDRATQAVMVLGLRYRAYEIAKWPPDKQNRWADRELTAGT